MSVKAKVEALIYATEEPVTLNQLAALLKDAALAELRAEEDARLALNETVSDGKPSPEDDESADDELENRRRSGGGSRRIPAGRLRRTVWSPRKISRKNSRPNSTKKT